MQPDGLRKAAQPELNNFEAELELLIVRTGICYKSEQLFVLWGNRSSTLKGSQGFTPLSFADIRLCQQIVDVGRLVSSSAQFLQDRNCLVVLTHTDITQAEIELASICVDCTFPSREKMRNRLFKSTLPR